jgi:hypothetical protein
MNKERKYIYRVAVAPFVVLIGILIMFLAGVESEFFKTMALMLTVGSAVWTVYWVIKGP